MRPQIITTSPQGKAFYQLFTEHEFYQSIVDNKCIRIQDNRIVVWCGDYSTSKMLTSTIITNDKGFIDSIRPLIGRNFEAPHNQGTPSDRARQWQVDLGALCLRTRFEKFQISDIKFRKSNFKIRICDFRVLIFDYKFTDLNRLNEFQVWNLR